MGTNGADTGNRKISLQQATTSGFLLVALGAALWGSDGLLRRGLAFELPAALVVFGEHLILVIVTLPLLLRARRVLKSLNGRDWAALIFIGAGASALATVLFTQAFVYGDPNTPLLLQKLQPIFAVAGASILLGERLHARYGMYFLLAVVGAYLIGVPDPAHPSLSALAPAALSVGAAFLWGLGTVLGRFLTAKIAFAELTALRFAVGLPATAVILLIQRQATAIPTVTGREVMTLVLLALIPGLIALLLYYRGLRETPASAATLAELSFPVTAVTVNYLAFGETLTGLRWLGLAILSATIVWMGVASTRGTRAVGIELPGPEESPALSSA